MSIDISKLNFKLTYNIREILVPALSYLVTKTHPPNFFIKFFTFSLILLVGLARAAGGRRGG